MTLEFNGWPRKIIGHLFYISSSFVHHLKSPVNSNWSYCLETINSGQNRLLFVLCDLEIWWMTFKNNRAPLLCHIKLCASFQSHRWIQTGVAVLKCSIRVKIGDFFPVWPRNLKLTLKNNRAPFYDVASSFVHHFITIGEFKLKLRFRNAQFG